ncbi:MAG: glycosyl hydrolase family 28 protein, partial [Bacteroides sp.]|nr:glycosyl hydrolase family 28 protein [Bacteroides sp.]
KYILLLFLSAMVLSLSAQGANASGIYCVNDYGAKGDRQTSDTKAIQAAIDKANAEGGGVVFFPADRYVSGSIILKDYVTLRFGSGSILLGSLDLADYPADLGIVRLADPYVWRGPLIYAEGVRYIGIEGNGIIDGRGTRENFPPLPRELQRPGLVRFTDCQFVQVKDVTMRNSACWTFHLRHCRDVSVQNITLDSNTNRNNDGIDIDGGNRISIVGCTINSEDDAIVLKSFVREKVSDIVIADCILTSTCSAIKIGTETVGDFENITISNCVIYGSRGINLFSVDGADINNVTISNISMRNSKSAIQLRLGNRLRPYSMPKDQYITTPGRLRNILISHVQATGVQDSQDFMCGIPGYPLENIQLSDIRISYYGNGTMAQATREIPEETRLYPKLGMFGDLPAYGFYIRHAKGVRLHNVRFDHLNPDMRPALVLDDVAGLNISDCMLQGGSTPAPLIRLHNVRDGVIRDSRPLDGCNLFVGVSGKDAKDIILQNNVLRKVKKTVEPAKEVKSEAIKEVGTIQ